jgi:hypothetical protein
VSDTDTLSVLPSHSLTGETIATSSNTITYTYNFINDASYTVASVSTYQIYFTGTNPYSNKFCTYSIALTLTNDICTF